MIPKGSLQYIDGNTAHNLVLVIQAPILGLLGLGFMLSDLGFGAGLRDRFEGWG